MPNNRMLVVAAHTGDFVWRCGGTISKYVQQGRAVGVLIMSSGLRGEANTYWNTPGANEKDGRAQRLNEARQALDMLGVKDLYYLDLPDYPMPIDAAVTDKIAHIIREFRPDLIVTHDKFDVFNPDHNAVSAAVLQAQLTASGAGYKDGLAPTSRQIPIFGFEPHFTEISDFKPDVYVDITQQMAAKEKVMCLYTSQTEMKDIYMCKARIRGAEASFRYNRPGCQYAEAFSRFFPCGASGDFVW